MRHARLMTRNSILPRLQHERVAVQVWVLVPVLALPAVGIALFDLMRVVDFVVLAVLPVLVAFEVLQVVTMVLQVLAALILLKQCRQMNY